MRSISVRIIQTTLFLRRGLAGKPEWMLDAEREARTAQGGKGPNNSFSAENTFMNSVKHEIGSEAINNTRRLQSLLESQLQQLRSKGPGAERDSLRRTALTTRNQLIIQRESAGFTKNNAEVIEQMFPIPI